MTLSLPWLTQPIARLWARFVADQKALYAMVWSVRWPLLALALFCGFALRYIGINQTPSMHEKFVFIERGVQPKVGDLIVYHFHGVGLPGMRLTGHRFFKRVRGLAGSIVTVDAERQVFLNGVSIGFAKTRTKESSSLEPIVAPGGSLIVPDGYAFVAGDTPDSFDSRYADSGLVKLSSIIGVAHALF